MLVPAAPCCTPPYPMGPAALAPTAYPVLLAAVGGEVVHGHLDALALLQLLQGGHDEVKVEGVWVVEVVVVEGGLLLLLLGEHLWGAATVGEGALGGRCPTHRGVPHLVEGVHGQQDHPGHVQGLDNHPGHGGLPRGTATSQACGRRRAARPHSPTK